VLDFCIIGGGASGLVAAVAAAGQGSGKSVLVLEKKPLPGKKLAATGNGKCNLTNRACPGAKETLAFFASIGIFTRTEEQGRVYPYAMQAKDVVYALVERAKGLGVEIRTECPVRQVKKIEEGFQVDYEGGCLKAHSVLIAAGGKAGPQFGSAGDGYVMAKALGHHVTRLAPVLTGLETTVDISHLKGIRVKARVFLKKDGRQTAEEQGEVQFNQDGLSGICVMNLSRSVKLKPGEAFAEGMARYSVCVDFLPDLDLYQTKRMLMERGGIPGMKGEDLLLSVVPDKLKQELISAAGISPRQGARDISPAKQEVLSHLLKSWELPLKGTGGWKKAQCTAGGVSLEEIHMDTMESKFVPGLYFAGEIIDYDGPCGGFNLQNAWETGIKAGKAAAHVL
jgi:predicted Rossmann fold flavoprotein